MQLEGVTQHTEVSRHFDGSRQEDTRHYYAVETRRPGDIRHGSRRTKVRRPQKTVLVTGRSL